MLCVLEMYSSFMDDIGYDTSKIIFMANCRKLIKTAL